MAGARFKSMADIGPHCRISSEIPLKINPDCQILSSKVAYSSSGLQPPKKTESIWQRRLFDHLLAAGLDPVWELKDAIPGRKFRVDIAFPNVKLAIEVDGWQHHGKTLSAFKSDRIKQNLFVVQGWRVLRFFPGEISRTPDGCVDMIKQAFLTPT